MELTSIEIHTHIHFRNKFTSSEQYTGNSFSRTTAMLLVEAGGEVLQLKHHGPRESISVG